MHPYQFKEQCIRVATMFMVKLNINHIQKFSITLNLNPTTSGVSISISGSVIVYMQEA